MILSDFIAIPNSYVLTIQIKACLGLLCSLSNLPHSSLFAPLSHVRRKRQLMSNCCSSTGNDTFLQAERHVESLNCSLHALNADSKFSATLLPVDHLHSTSARTVSYSLLTKGKEIYSAIPGRTEWCYCNDTLTAMWRVAGKILTKQHAVSPPWGFNLYHVAQHF